MISGLGGDVDATLKMGITNTAAYGTTRAGGNMAIAKYSKLLEKEGFAIFSIAPGLVDTSATSEDPGKRFSCLRSIWMRR